MLQIKLLSQVLTLIEWHSNTRRTPVPCILKATTLFSRVFLQLQPQLTCLKNSHSQFQNRVHRRPQLTTIPSLINTVPTATLHFFKIHYNTTLSLALPLQNGLFPSVAPNKCLYAFLNLSTCVTYTKAALRAIIKGTDILQVCVFSPANDVPK